MQLKHYNGHLSVSQKGEMAALPCQPCLTQGVTASTTHWGYFRSDNTSLEAAAGWSHDCAAAAEGAVVVHERRTGLVAHRSLPFFLGQVQRVHSGQLEDEDMRRVRARRLEFVMRLE